MIADYLSKSHLAISLLWLMGLASLLPGLGPSSLYAFETEPKQVLVLNSYHQGLEWTDSIMQGIEAEFAKQPHRPEIHVEYMDTKRYPPTTIFPVLHDLYVRKYGDNQPDLIIVSDDNAYKYILTVREELFPGVPVVFCGVNYFDADQLAGRQGITGIVEEFDLLGTLETALQLHPETERVFVINDTTTTGLANKRVVREIIPQFKQRLEFHFLETLTMEELQGQLQTLPPKSLVLLLSFNRDKAGRTFSYREAIKKIAPHSKAPIYGVWGFYLGKGIVGGNLTRGLDHGEAAAKMGLSILRGKAAGNNPVMREGTNTFMFDYPLMRKFGIGIEQLPPESIVANKPESFYHQNKRLVLAVGGVMAALSLLVLFLTLNILKRKRAEEALRESEERFRSVFETSAAGMAINSLDGRIWQVNPAICRFLGYPEDELLKLRIEDVTHPEDLKKTRHLYEDILAGRHQAFDHEKRYIRKDGSMIWGHATVAGVLDASGKPAYFVGFVQDITERKRAEEALRESDRMKTEFVMTAAHEFRTPLTSIQGFSEVLLTQEDISSEERKEFLTYISEKSNALAKIVASLLDIARIESGQGLSLDRELCPVNKAFIQVKPFLNTNAAKHRLELVLAEEDTLLNVDKVKIGQVLENLISNALKYSPAGSLVQVLGSSVQEGYQISVADQGIGMTSEQVGRVFDKFYRADASHTATEGIGLGMSVVKHIVEAHGGEIWVESELSVGTTVSFTVPPDCHIAQKPRLEGATE